MSTSALIDFPSHNPATGEEIARYRNCSQSEVEQAVARAHASSQAWQALGFNGRKKILVAWNALLTKGLGELAELVALETGKPISDATLEISLAIGHLDWASRNASKYLSPVSRNPGLIMANMKARVERAPYGVVGVIGPWNYPVFTPMGSIA